MATLHGVIQPRAPAVHNDAGQRKDQRGLGNVAVLRGHGKVRGILPTVSQLCCHKKKRLLTLTRPFSYSQRARAAHRQHAEHFAEDLVSRVHHQRVSVPGKRDGPRTCFASGLASPMACTRSRPTAGLTRCMIPCVGSVADLCTCSSPSVGAVPPPAAREALETPAA